MHPCNLDTNNKQYKDNTSSSSANLLIPDVLGTSRWRLLHGNQSQDLQKVILHHIPVTDTLSLTYICKYLSYDLYFTSFPFIRFDVSKQVPIPLKLSRFLIMSTNTITFLSHSCIRYFFIPSGPPYLMIPNSSKQPPLPWVPNGSLKLMTTEAIPSLFHTGLKILLANLQTDRQTLIQSSVDDKSQIPSKAVRQIFDQ